MIQNFHKKTKIPVLIQNRRKNKEENWKKKTKQNMVAKIKESTRKTTNDIYYHRDKILPRY